MCVTYSARLVFYGVKSQVLCLIYFTNYYNKAVYLAPFKIGCV
jgi:hypothetical protein